MERSVARTAAMPAASMGLALLVGVLVIQWLPSLPPRWFAGLLLALASLLAWRWPRGRWVGCILIGVAWAMFRGGLAMDARLPRSLEAAIWW
jgi:competence protein ComEC